MSKNILHSLLNDLSDEISGVYGYVQTVGNFLTLLFGLALRVTVHFFFAAVLLQCLLRLKISIITEWIHLTLKCMLPRL